MEKTVNFETEIELINDDNNSFASVSLNPYFQWAKIVITDDLPNLNKQRVPLEEFDNLIRTGVNTPIKMARGGISPGHPEAFGNPIGVLAQLIKESNKVIALAALWKKERPDDIARLKEMYASGNPPKVSWEISYQESIDESGVEALKGTSLDGIAIVGNPAYSGRTAFVAMSSANGIEVEIEEPNEFLSEAAVWTRAYINNLPDSAFLYIEPGGKKDSEGKTVPRSLRHLPVKDKTGKVDPPHARNAASRLGQSDTGKDWLSEDLRKRLLSKVESILKSSRSEKTDMEELEQLQEEVKTLKAQLDEKDKAVNDATAELETLRAFKEDIEKKEADAAKLESIKAKFVEAGIEKDETYFEDNREKLLSLAEETLDFMIQELVAFSSKTEKDPKDEKQTKSSKVPPIPGDDGGNLNDPKELGRMLREARLKTE